jgi:hypothetical protein
MLWLIKTVTLWVLFELNLTSGNKVSMELQADARGHFDRRIASRVRVETRFNQEVDDYICTRG